MTQDNAATKRRIYPLPNRELTPEQIAVTFAMTSRNPAPFDEIASRVSETRAADFNERWVVGYGHASVAEHAGLHLAVENVSRLVCDAIEDNRLASFTEKSSRYQQLSPESFVVPSELDEEPVLRRRYIDLMTELFSMYAQSIDALATAEAERLPRRDEESAEAHRLRTRRPVYDSCRVLLPASALTNVGVSINARSMEYAISKLKSSPTVEAQNVADELLAESVRICPTLVKYAGYSPGLDLELDVAHRETPDAIRPLQSGASLMDWTADPVEKLAERRLYRQGMGYDEAQRAVERMNIVERRELVEGMLSRLGRHDPLPREFEHVEYTFEFVLDYGGLRELRRHRMTSPVFPLLTAAHGYEVPPLVEQHGWGGEYRRLLDQASALYLDLVQCSAVVAQYAVTHAHLQRVLLQFNLREFYHIMRLRADQKAHPSIRLPVVEAIGEAVKMQPELFNHIRPRHAGDWWPMPTETP